MKLKLMCSLFIITALGLSACGMFAGNRAAASPEVMMEAAPAMEEMAAAGGEYVSKDIGLSSAPIERIVIKNANLSIVVVDPAEAMQAIASMAEGMGGWVVSSNLYKTTTYQNKEVPIANITVRVPAEKLTGAMEQIKALVPDASTDILNEEISGQDVTSEYTDTTSRLNNLKAAEAQLVEIMDQATETEDVMSVFRELTSIREQIEVLQGQLKYYDEAARLSALSVNIQAKEAFEPITIAGWQPGLEAQKALQALVNGLKSLVNLLIWFIIFVAPILLIIALPVYFILRFIRKRCAATKTQGVKSTPPKK